jgi:hypothetical protein
MLCVPAVSNKCSKDNLGAHKGLVTNWPTTFHDSAPSLLTVTFRLFSFQHRSLQVLLVTVVVVRFESLDLGGSAAAGV